MRKQIKFIFYLFWLFGMSPLLFGEMPQEEVLSLENTLAVAYANNPRMMEAKKEISASKGRWIQAEALPDPEIGLDIGGFKKNGDGENKKDLGSFFVKQPLDPLGTRFLKGRAAHDGVKIAKNILHRVWTEVSTEVQATYASILAMEKAGEVAGQNLEATRQFLSQVEGRFQAGSALKSDVMRAKIEVSRAENDLLISQKDLKVLKGRMNLLLGRFVETPLWLTDSLTYKPLRYQYQNLIEKALRERADIQVEKTRLGQTKKGFWSAFLKTVFPKMSIGVERTTEDFDNDTSLLIEASYPLWGFNLGAVKEAKAEREKQEVRLEAFKRQVGLELYEAFLEAELSDQQVTIQKKALEEAGELLKQMTLQYQEGETSFLIYLENIKTIKETRLAYFNALKNYRQKVAELEKAFQESPVPKGEQIS